jgi:ParB family chromosome partitioning protein
VKRKALGRGLDALLPSVDLGGGARLREIPVHEIVPNPEQPRKRFSEEALAELARSIGEQGVLQPIIVRQVEQGYQIVVGERRWRAALQAGVKTIPAVIREVDDEQALVFGLIENIQREDLSPVEQATAYQMLLELHALTQEELARKLGRDRATVANTIRLLQLPRQVLAMLDEGKLSTGHGKALLGLRSEQDRLALAHRIVAQGLSVRQTEALVRRLNAAGEERPERRRELPAQIEALQESLGRKLNAKVRFDYGPRRGRIMIEYFSREALDRIVELLQSLPDPGQ